MSLNLKEWGQKYVLEEGVGINMSFEYKDTLSASDIVGQVKGWFHKQDEVKPLATDHVFIEKDPFRRIDQRVKDKIWPKGIFERNLFSQKISDEEFSNIINTGKEKSGEIVDFFPFCIKDVGFGMFFITTKGICYILQDKLYTGSAALGVIPTAGLLGAIAVGSAQSIWNKNKIKKGLEQMEKGLNKYETKLVERVKQYSADVIARSYSESMFIPYQNINKITYSHLDQHILIHFGDEHYAYFWFAPSHLDKLLANFK